jgi:hypothetical protein
VSPVKYERGLYIQEEDIFHYFDCTDCADIAGMCAVGALCSHSLNWISIFTILAARDILISSPKRKTEEK